jgi:predicted dehydrogenase
VGNVEEVAAVSDRRIRWAVVGVGDIARKRVMPAIAADGARSELYACVTRDPRKLADLPHTGPQRVYEHIEEALADSAVDAVYVATPVFLHAAQALAALDAGKDVLVEKPFAMNANEAAPVLAAARRNHRRFAVAYFRRFWPHFERTNATIASGQLGQIAHVRVTFQSWYDPDPADPKAWRVRRSLSGGGVLADAGSHRLDLLAWWFGEPRRLFAEVSTLTHRYDADDSARLLIDFASGVRVSASFHWNAKTWADEIHVTGTEGQLALTPCDGGMLTLTVDGRPHVESLPRPENGHAALIADFTRAILEDDPPRFGGEDGLVASRMMDAAFESSHRGGWVNLD